MKEYDIFAPLYFNEGEPVEARKFQALHKSLLGQFDGLTFFPQPNKGFWKMGGVTFQDEIVIYRVLASKVRKARRFLSQLKEKMKKDFRQEDILIIERDVKTL